MSSVIGKDPETGNRMNPELQALQDLISDLWALQSKHDGDAHTRAVLSAAAVIVRRYAERYEGDLQRAANDTRALRAALFTRRIPEADE